MSLFKIFFLICIIIAFSTPSFSSNSDISEAKKTALLFIQFKERNQNEKVYEILSTAKKEYLKTGGQVGIKINSGKQYAEYCKGQPCYWKNFKISELKQTAPGKVECKLAGDLECEDGIFPNNSILRIVFENKHWKIDKW